MSEVKRLSLDMQYPFQYMSDENGNLCYYADYAELKAQCDELAAKSLELCIEAAHVYQKYNITQMPDMDLVDCQTIQELRDLVARLRAGEPS